MLICMNPTRRIRTQIFKVTQEELASIAKVEQPTVSRWEKGIGEPSLRHIKRIRAEAKRRGLRWDDDALFSGEGRAA